MGYQFGIIEREVVNMWHEVCDIYSPNAEKKREDYKMPRDIVDKGTVKEYKFMNYLIKIYKL